MFLITAPNVKNTHILAGNHSMFPRNGLDQLKSLSIPSLDLSEKFRKVFIKQDNF